MDILPLHRPRRTAFWTACLSLLALLSSPMATRADSDGFMRGRVTTGGIGVPGVLIQVRAAGSAPNIGFGWAVDVLTDGNGNWVAPIRRTDDPNRHLYYSVSQSKPGFTFNPIPIIDVTVGDANNVNMFLRSAPVQTRFIFPDGSPVPGATAVLSMPNPTSVDQIPIDILPPFSSFPITSVDFANGPTSFGGNLPADNFGVVLRGTITIESGIFGSDPFGPIQFQLASDDGSRLWINGSSVVNNDGLHGFTTQFGQIQLKAGAHNAEIRMFENSGFAGLFASYNYTIANPFPVSVIQSPMQLGSGTMYVFDFTNLARTTSDTAGNGNIGPFLGNNLAHSLSPSLAGYTFEPSVAQVFAGQPTPVTFTVSSVAPSLTTGPGQTINEDSAAIEIPFTVVGVPQPTLTVSSSDPSVLPDAAPYIRILGSGTSRRISVLPPPNANGSVTLTLRAVNNLGTATANIPININPINDPPVAGAGSSLSFSGDGSSVRSDGVGGLDSPNAAHTIEAWIKPEGQGDTHYSANFDSGTPTGMTLSGTARIDNGILKLTDVAQSQAGDAIIEDFGNSTPVNKFEATFTTYIFGGTDIPADGFSFNLIPASAALDSVAEEPLSSGLSITFDIYDNGFGEAPAVEVFWLGQLIGRQNLQVALPTSIQTLEDAAREVFIRLSPNGALDLTYGDTIVFSQLQTPYSASVIGTPKWALRARTGGLAENQWIDNLSITGPEGTRTRSWPLVFGQSGPGSHHWLLNPSDSPNELLLQFGVWSGVQISGHPIPVNQWTHLATTWDPQTKFYTLFINGQQKAQVTAADGFNFTSFALRLGTPPFTGPAESDFRGLLDELRIWNRPLTGGEIKDGLSKSLTGREDNLVLYYRFDEGIGTIATDSAGNPAGQGGRNDGQISRATYGPPASANGNGTLQFNGTNNYVQIPGLNTILPTTEVTIEFWQKVDAQRAQSSFGTSPDPNGKNRIGAHVPWSDGVVYWDFGDLNSNGRLAYLPPEPIIGTWQHWAFVASQSGNYMEIYRNGVREASKPGMTPFSPSANTQFRIGASDAVFLQGQIDEFRIWNVARSSTQIRSDMNGPLQGNESGLLAYYRFDDATGGVLTDSAANPHNGTLINKPLWDPPNDAFGILIMDEDNPSKVFLPAYDVELSRNEAGASLIYTITAPPQHGNLRFRADGPNVTTGNWSDANQNPLLYIPLPDFTGPDAFTYEVRDNGGLTATRTVQLFVAPLNDPPTISPLPIPNQIVEEDSSSAPIPFTIQDAESDPSQLSLSISSTETRLIPPRVGFNILFGGTGTNRTLRIIPATGEIGTSTITLTLTDPAGASTSTSFQVRVQPKPAYALLDLGSIPGRADSLAFSVNDQTWVAGAAQSQPTDPRGVLYKGVAGNQGWTDIGTFGGAATIAYHVNNSNIVVGFSSFPNGRREAFRWDSGSLVTLDQAGSQRFSEARAINSRGLIVGAIGSAAPDTAFRWSDGNFNLLPTPPGTLTSGALDINDSSFVVGFTRSNDKGEIATYWDDLDRRFTITPLSGDTQSRAHAINNSGQIVGSSQNANGVSRAFLHDTARSSTTQLGTLPSANDAVARSINDFGQVVGQSGNGPQSQRATLYTAGRVIDLNEVIHDHRDANGNDFEFAKSNWELVDATSINRDGAIAGIGRLNGVQRGFLALPAWVIGRQIARPLGAVARTPEIEIVHGRPGDTPENAFFWSIKEARLYAIRPVTARLRWFTSNTDTSGSGSNLVVNSDRIIQIGINVWPKIPTYHVATAPVEVEPQGISFPYSFQEVRYSTMQGVSVEASTRRFNSTQTGYSVLYYLKSDGFTPSPQENPPYFDVVKTILWDDPAFQLKQRWNVGDVITFPGHYDYFSKNGHVLFEHALYDGAGDDRAYDRFSRLGPIIPVNKPTERTAALFDPLAVAWYHTNRIGVAWADTPVLYTLDWPANAPHIIVASGLGSGTLEPNNFLERRVYNQPIRALPGYNPNEEHSILVSTSNGEGLFALRNDINVVTRQSEAYSLLKYKDPASRAWRIKVYKVVPEEDPYYFRFSGEAGKEIQPPFPLSLFTLCTESSGVPGKGPWWEDYNGKIYARAAGVFGQNTNIHIRWSYPLQPGFSYDFNSDGTNDLSSGICVPWFDHRPQGSFLLAPNTSAGTEGVSIEVVYDIRWPDDSPILQTGESLVGPRRGLPGVFRMADVQIVYDDLNPVDASTITNLALMYDPISTRRLPLPANWVWPTSIQRQNINGKEYFPKLPYSIKQRLIHDPINKEILFTGILDETFGVGPNPLLLPNVMSPRERLRILQLAEGNPNWETLIDNLYNLTRNPNQVDLAPKDGKPDVDLRIGLTTEIRDGFKQIFIGGVVPGISTNYTTNIVTISLPRQTNIVSEKFGDGPKSLTAGLNAVPSAQSRPLKALEFNGNSGAVDLGNGIGLGSTFTLEAWIQPTAPDNNTRAILGNEPASGRNFRSPGIWIQDRNRLLFGFGTGSAFVSVSTSPVLATTSWNHVAATFDGTTCKLYVNGISVLSSTNLAGLKPTTTPLRFLGRADSFFQGRMDEVRIWDITRDSSEIRHDMIRRLNGAEDGLLACWRLDEGTGNRTFNAVPQSPVPSGNLIGSVSWINSTAPTGIPPRYMTIAENNNPDLGGLPVGLHIIRIDDGPYQGDLKVLPGDNIFDERVSLRHSSDFGGAPERLTFEWYYKPDAADFDPTNLPQVDPQTGNITDARGWITFPALGNGVNDVTLGEGNATGLLTLGDNWFIARYQGYVINGVTNWSEWVGDPAGIGTPRAALVEGWIKRVVRGLNPFDARTRDFHSSEANTFASMLVQAGPRYEGPIAFNPSADNINRVGLIEAYTTVLERGKDLSIEGVPAVDFDAANNALLLVSSRIADLYALLGNEAFADAEDPTIGFGTKTGEYGSLAPSIFSFQNQLDSLLEEELVLLRGRDDRNAGVSALPVYNRLFWNFTLGDGEVAYQQAYNIGDQNFDGFIDEKDARILYPQGHGDAWGHYLTAIKTYYQLLRHPKFTWKPRTERVSIGGAAIEVDFLDERKFARIAAAKARTGKQILDLTYRSRYVEDPEGQWQGYKDADSERAWGVDEWSRRAGQGAFLDWVTANAILPASDTNPNHVGIQKIDRTTVAELSEIVSQASQIQAKIDESDSGLNPLGLARGAVPFDIDPTFLEVGSTAQIGRRAVQGLTQFDQILERAVKALKNSSAVWDDANKATELLRKTQDSVDQFTRNVRDQEIDFKNRLIEIFGYPYAGDIGAGKTYPSGYDGPDLYHFMYVNRSQITGDNSPPATNFVGIFNPVRAWVTNSVLGTTNFVTSSGDFWLGFAPTTLNTETLPVLYPLSTADYGFEAPTSWGQRRAAGELQLAISDMVQAQAQLKIALQNYDGLIQDIQASFQLLNEQYNVGTNKISILRKNKTDLVSANDALLGMKRAQLAVNRINESVTETTENLLDGIPKFAVAGLAFGGDLTAPVRAAVRTGIMIGKLALSISSDVLEGEQRATELGKEAISLQTDIDVTTLDTRFEVLQRLKELEHQVRDEAATRLAAYNQAEVLNQAVARYHGKLAEGERLIEERVRFRRDTASQTTQQRYQDMTFRIFRNDALQKYRASFDLAARYVYLAATAYDYEVNFLGTDQRAGRRFLTEIVRQRSLGQLVDGDPAVGTRGLADPLARLSANWEVLKPRFGVIAPQIADTRFSLREEWFRIKGQITPNLGPDGIANTPAEIQAVLEADAANQISDASWRNALASSRVPNLWDIPEFRRFCRPFAPEQAGPQPGIVIRFPTTITFGLNFFGWPLAGGDSAYDPTQFSTKIARAGVWLSGSDGTQISQTPRVYLVPIGMDVQRAPTGDTLATREWRILDQAIPAPFPIGASDLSNPSWIPMLDSLGGSFVDIRRYGSFPARHDSGAYSEQDLTNDTRLIGRSAWNTEWMLIIPGGTLLFDPDQGIEALINSVSDIKLYFQTYSYSGD